LRPVARPRYPYPRIAILTFPGAARFAADDFVGAVVGIENPRKLKLPQIVQTRCPFALLFGSLDGWHEDGHQDRDDRNDHE
jgi:hypothetical protein